MISHELLPQTWSMVPLRRVLRKLSRPIHAKDEVITAYRDGCVTARSIRREEGYTFSDLEDGYQGVEVGDFVFHALDGFAGAVGVSDAQGKCSPVYHVCTTVVGDDPRFYAYALRAMSTLGFLEVQAGNVRQRSVDFRTWEAFARIPMPRPPASEQSIIADYLDAETARIDALIVKKLHLVELVSSRFESQRQAAILNMVDPTNQDGLSIRHPKLGVIIYLQRGHDLPFEQRVEGDIPIVSSGGISGTHNKASANGPGVITGRYGSIGKVFFMDQDYWPLNTTLYVKDFRKRYPRWVYHLLAAIPLDIDSAKSAVTGIDRNVVNQLRVPLPSVVTQRKIADMLDQEEMRSKRISAAVSRQIELLREHRQALVTKAVTGSLKSRDERGC